VNVLTGRVIRSFHVSLLVKPPGQVGDKIVIIRGVPPTMTGVPRRFGRVQSAYSAKLAALYLQLGHDELPHKWSLVDPQMWPDKLLFGWLYKTRWPTACSATPAPSAALLCIALVANKRRGLTPHQGEFMETIV